MVVETAKTCARALVFPVALDDDGLDRYLIASMGSLPQETLRVLFLDGARHLIAEEVVPDGAPCRGGLSARAIFRRAIAHDAAALVLVHNHPGGDPAPSRNDIAAAYKIAEVGRSLEIDILDHIIVTATRLCRLSAMQGADVSGTRLVAPVLSDIDGTVTDACVSSRQAALENAKQTVHRRKSRSQLLGAPHLFGEPAWDILIDLFIHHCEDKRVSMSELCLIAGIPASSALRLVHRLCDKQLLDLVPDTNDGRRHFVALTQDTLQRLEAYFSCAR